MDRKIKIPSKKIERSNGSLNIASWGYAGLISMFLVGALVNVAYMMFYSFLYLTKAYFYEYMWIMIAEILVYSLIFGIGMFAHLNGFLKAYAITDGKIIVGRIKAVPEGDIDSIIVQAATTKMMIDNFDNSSVFGAAVAMQNLGNVLELISYNTKEGFADLFFFTDAYKKKEYNNPVLIKETSKYYLYKCDNNKKVRIRKMYTDMPEGTKNTGMVVRILIRTLIIFSISFVLKVTDLGVSYATNQARVDYIENSIEELNTSLQVYGYEYGNHSSRNVGFSKKSAGNHISSVSFSFGKNGELESCTYDVYYNDADEVEEELRTIFSLYNHGFTDDDIDEFISNTISLIEGEYTYSKLESEDEIIRLGTSDGCAHIHN